MRNIKYCLLYVLLAITVIACDKDDRETDVKPTATGTMTDLDGNEYHWLRFGKLDWMGENLKSGTAYCDIVDNWGYSIIYMDDYEDAKNRIDVFGNLYTYEQALENAPEGWRLPTDEEWMELERMLGMSKSESIKENWRKGAGDAIMKSFEDGHGMNLRCGGSIQKWGYGNNLREYHIRDYGYYWTSTSDERWADKAIYYRKIVSTQNKIFRNSSTLEKYFSVRYVREAE